MAEQRLSEEQELRRQGERLTEARFQTAARRRSAVSRALMAELVGEIVGDELHETQWRRYENGDSRAPISIVRATAQLSGLSEAYLFGIETPGPIIDTSRDRKLTDEEIERAEKQVADEERKKKKKRG